MTTQENSDTVVVEGQIKSPADLFYVEVQREMQLALFGIMNEAAEKANELQLSIAAPAQCAGSAMVSAFYETLRHYSAMKDPDELKSMLEKLGEIAHEAYIQKLDLLFDPESDLSKLRRAAEQQQAKGASTDEPEQA